MEIQGENFFTALNHQCLQCNHINEIATIQFPITSKEYNQAKKNHPDWDFKNGKVGIVICENCGARNHVLMLLNNNRGD